MTAERITPAAVEAEAITFDAQDRAVVANQVVLDFGQAGVLAALLTPREWEEVASYLLALIDRAPLKDGRPYVAHRTILGSIANDLRTYARLAGEPVGLEADLRAATSKAEERRIRERIADQDAALERRLDEIALEQAARLAHDPYLPGVVIADADFAERGIGLTEPEEEPTDAPVIAPTATETDDVLAWL